MLSAIQKRPVRVASRAGPIESSNHQSTDQIDRLSPTPSTSRSQASLTRIHGLLDQAEAEILVAARLGVLQADLQVEKARLAAIAAIVAVLDHGPTIAPDRAAFLLQVSPPTARRLGVRHSFARKSAGRWQFFREPLLAFIAGEPR